MNRNRVLLIRRHSVSVTEQGIILKEKGLGELVAKTVYSPKNGAELVFFEK
jgi:hypothetical protein